MAGGVPAAQPVRHAVVVGVDGSDCALRAVVWGVAEAVRWQVPLRLVTAFGQLIDPAADHPDHPDRHRRDRDAVLHRARRQLDEADAVARVEGTGVEVGHELLVGHPISLLRAESRHARLVVVGDRGDSAVEGLLTGSVAVGLAVHAFCPVVVVRGPEHAPSGRPAGRPVVVGVDGSDTGEAALGFAFEAAAARRVPLVAVHAGPGLLTDLLPPPDRAAIEGAARGLLGQRLGPWTLKYPDVTVAPVVARGPAAAVLIEHAAGAQLLVVGSRGRGEFSGLILGSVSHALLHRAPCPVVVVRPDAGTTANPV